MVRYAVSVTYKTLGKCFVTLFFFFLILLHLLQLTELKTSAPPWAVAGHQLPRDVRPLLLDTRVRINSLLLI